MTDDHRPETPAPDDLSDEDRAETTRILEEHGSAGFSTEIRDRIRRRPPKPADVEPDPLVERLSRKRDSG